VNMSKKHILLPSLAFGVIVLCLAGYDQGENMTLSGKTIRIGYSSNLFPDVDMKDAQVAIQLWSKALNQQIGTGAIPKAILFDDLQSIVNAANNGEIDMVSLFALDYIKIRDRASLEPALVPLNRDETGEEKILLVRRDKGITKISQLKNKRLVLQTGTKGIVSLMWLDTLSFAAGLA